MSQIQSRKPSRFVRAVRKSFVSGFVVFSFVAYALHEHFTAPDGGSSAILPTPIALVTQVLPTAMPTTAAQPTAAPPPRATEPPIPPTAAPPTAAPPRAT